MFIICENITHNNLPIKQNANQTEWLLHNMHSPKVQNFPEKSMRFFQLSNRNDNNCLRSSILSLSGQLIFIGLIFVLCLSLSLNVGFLTRSIFFILSFIIFIIFFQTTERKLFLSHNNNIFKFALPIFQSILYGYLFYLPYRIYIYYSLEKYQVKDLQTMEKDITNPSYSVEKLNCAIAIMVIVLIIIFNIFIFPKMKIHSKIYKWIMVGFILLFIMFHSEDRLLIELIIFMLINLAFVIKLFINKAQKKKKLLKRKEYLLFLSHYVKHLNNTFQN